MYKIALVYSNYYPEITQNLLSGFKNAAPIEWNVEEFEVFGVAEIPFKLNSLTGFDGYAVVGCVCQGETFHDQLINNFVFNEVNRISLMRNIPVGYGILHVKTIEQAVARATGEENRAVEAVKALQFLLD